MSDFKSKLTGASLLFMFGWSSLAGGPIVDSSPINDKGISDPAGPVTISPVMGRGSDGTFNVFMITPDELASLESKYPNKKDLQNAISKIMWERADKVCSLKGYGRAKQTTITKRKGHQGKETAQAVDLRFYQRELNNRAAVDEALGQAEGERNWVGKNRPWGYQGAQDWQPADPVTAGFDHLMGNAPNAAVFIPEYASMIGIETAMLPITGAYILGKDVNANLTGHEEVTPYSIFDSVVCNPKPKPLPPAVVASVGAEKHPSAPSTQQSDTNASEAGQARSK